MNIKNWFHLIVLFVMAYLLTGCASSSHDNPRDPLESFNRSVYKFNDSLDRAAFRPIAKTYTKVVPSAVRNCVHNVFSNINDIWSGTNSFLQGRQRDFINTLGRVLFNTTMGIGGCFDVASTKGSVKRYNDFGLTLAVWGMPPGPYLVLPILGASTFRDTVGVAADWKVGSMGSVNYVNDISWRNSIWGLQVVDTRANLLEVSKIIDQVALDPYTFVRDAYFQRRAAQILNPNSEEEAALPDYSIQE